MTTSKSFQHRRDWGRHMRQERSSEWVCPPGCPVKFTLMVAYFPDTTARENLRLAPCIGFCRAGRNRDNLKGDK